MNNNISSGFILTGGILGGKILKHKKPYAEISIYNSKNEIIKTERIGITRKNKKLNIFNDNEGAYSTINITNTGNSTLRINSLFLNTTEINDTYISDQSKSKYTNSGSRIATNDSIPVERSSVTIMDSTAKAYFSNTELVEPELFSQNPCTGNELLYVGGMNYSQAMEATAVLFNSSNACSISWILDGPSMTVTATRLPTQSNQPDVWSVIFQGPTVDITYILGAGSTSNNPSFPNETFGIPTMEYNIIYNELTNQQRLDYFLNQQQALNALINLQANCPDTDGDGNPNINTDGNGNAFLHAYWTALNTRDFGNTLALRLVAAHEGFGGNPFAQGVMDLYNDDLGYLVANQYPTASDQQLETTIFNRVSTGKGKRLITGSQIVSTTFNICD